MRLTTQELDKMQSVDIGATSADTLSDVSGMAFQKGLSREERIARFMQQAQNLYCFCVGGVSLQKMARPYRTRWATFCSVQKAGCNFGYGPFLTSRQSVPRAVLSKASLLSLRGRGII